MRFRHWFLGLDKRNFLFHAARLKNKAVSSQVLSQLKQKSLRALEGFFATHYLVSR